MDSAPPADRLKHAVVPVRRRLNGGNCAPRVIDARPEGSTYHVREIHLETFLWPHFLETGSARYSDA